MSGALAPIGMGLQIGGQIGKGIAARGAANRNAEFAEAEAVAIRRDGASDVARLRDEARMMAGEAIAAQGGSGLAIGTGSLMDALRENAINANLDQMQARTNAEARARSRELEAAGSRASGRAAMLQAILGAATSAVQGAASGGFAGGGAAGGGGSSASGGSGASSGVMRAGAGPTTSYRTLR